MRAAAAILAITALSFFVFPGHTYLQQDTQIYVSILENQWNGALAGDLLVQRPHVNFTFYDELTNALRWLTRMPLKSVLEGEQLLFRAFGFAGVYLIALSFDLDSAAALVVTAIAALGATIAGPAVLAIEYEPTPRAFAVPLLLLAIGLSLRRRYWLAGAAGACAFLLHAPTTWPFLIALLCLSTVRKQAAFTFVPIAVAAIALVCVGSVQSVAEPQHLFTIIPAALERLQRMRASYNYVSTWWIMWIGQYLLFAALAFLALWRVQASREKWVLLSGLVTAGISSIPVSWLLLEHYKLSIVPQIQPARALLFVTQIAVIVSAVAGCRAAQSKKWVEATAWFCFCLWVSASDAFFSWPGWRAALMVLGLALLLGLFSRLSRLVTAFLLAPAMAIPAGIVTYHQLETPQLKELAVWAKAATPPTSVFAFPDAGHDRSLGWFRATALRPVYADWKGGGQLNYLEEFGYEWWRRWQAVMQASRSSAEYRALGIDFLVIQHRLADPALPAYQNSRYFVYPVSSY